MGKKKFGGTRHDVKEILGDDQLRTGRGPGPQTAETSVWRQSRAARQGSAVSPSTVSAAAVEIPSTAAVEIPSTVRGDTQRAGVRASAQEVSSMLEWSKFPFDITETDEWKAREAQHAAEQKEMESKLSEVKSRLSEELETMMDLRKKLESKEKEVKTMKISLTKALDDAAKDLEEKHSQKMQEINEQHARITAGEANLRLSLARERERNEELLARLTALESKLASEEARAAERKSLKIMKQQADGWRALEEYKHSLQDRVGGLEERATAAIKDAKEQEGQLKKIQDKRHEVEKGLQAGILDAMDVFYDNFTCIKPERMLWPEGNKAVEAMLRNSALHTRCCGRDGTFIIGNITHVRVWKLKNEVLWREYANRRASLKGQHKSRDSHIKPLEPPIPRNSLRGIPSSEVPECLKWEDSYDHSLNEALLWHGTAPSNIHAIATSGMDERVCRVDGMLGAGLYFAQDSCKAGQYAPPDHNGSHWFFLCRVLLGNPSMTRTYQSGIRKPPAMFDSIVFEPGRASLGHHRELVVYDRHQVHPEFLIEACTRP